MTKHKKIYLDAMGYTEGDFVPCECCDSEATDIHHIKARGMGGTSNPMKNSIFNLMALCRRCHDEYGDKRQHLDKLWGDHYRTILDRYHSWIEGHHYG